MRFDKTQKQTLNQVFLSEERIMANNQINLDILDQVSYFINSGSYTPDQDAIMRKTIGCTLGAKYYDDDNNGKQAPGPGQYDIPV